MTTTETAPSIAVFDHPAKFSRPVLEQLQALLDTEDARAVRPLTVFDPFAGTGLVHTLGTGHGLHTVGVELEPEWAACHPRTVQGNALHLPFADESMDGLVTSPCYGNRMADAHNAQDPCKTCGGDGFLRIHESDEQTCKACKGSGLSKRNTYTHRLRVATGDRDRRLHDDNAGAMRWGKKYRTFHEACYREALRAIRPGGFALVNISNHPETKDGVTVEHRVSEWTMNAWLMLGVHLAGAYPVRTARLREGANSEARCEFEFVLHFRVPDPHPLAGRLF